MRKPYHYWAIHKEVTEEILNKFTIRERAIISNDVEHKSGIYASFERQLTEETEKRFQSPTFRWNQAYTFKIPYRA